MIRQVKLLFIIFVLVLPPYVYSNGLRGVSPIPVIDSEDNQIILYKESHALIVGVSNYTYDWPQLSGVQKDIKLVDLVLKESGFNTVILNNPSYEHLKKAIEKFIIMYGQDVDNRLLFYFAGHGHTVKLSFGEDMGYFVPTDAPHPRQDKNGFLSKGFNMELMQVYAKQIQSKHALFLFDSCFSGSFFSKTRSVPSNISYKISQPVRQFVTSGSANELVPDQSIFREQFVYALKGEGDLDSDGYLTGTELGEFLQKKVINYSNGTQHPQYGKMRNPRLDKGDFVFPLKTPRRNSELDINVKREERKLISVKKKFHIEKKQLEKTRQLIRKRKNIEKEREKLTRERLRIASKIRKKPSSVIKRSQYCPDNMVIVDGRNFIASRDGNVPYEVTVKTICVDIFEVTQKKYLSIMGDNPSHFKGVFSRPVENVTWLQAKTYCQKIGKRLPTEWEWENATGSQNSKIYYWGNKFNSEFAWFNGNSSSRTNPVGQKKPNSIGLYDMVGNVWEWTDSGEDNIKYLRGGSWNSFAGGMRISERRRSDPLFKSSTYGFRCVQ
jgi:hypothetical protein